MKFKTYFRVIFIIALISLSTKSFSAAFEYIAIPHYSANTVEFRNTTNTNTAGTLNFNNEMSQFNFPFTAFGPNATLIWKNYFFISIDNGSTGGVLIYKYSDLFDSTTGSYNRNSNPPIVLQTGASSCGLVVDQITGDLFVATFRLGNVSGKVTEYTKASNWSVSSALVLPIPRTFTPTPFIDYYSGLMMDMQGNIWAGDLDQHCLICYTKSSNYDNFYFVVNGEANTYSAVKANGAGSNVSVKLFSDPEGLAPDPDGGIWFANNNDSDPQNTDGTFGKIKAAYIPSLLSLNVSGTRANPLVANYYTVPQNMVDVYYIPGAKFGGIAYNKPAPPSSPFGLYINDQGTGKLWYSQTLTNFMSFGNVFITNPGFGGISFNSVSTSFTITPGRHIRLNSGVPPGTISIVKGTLGHHWVTIPSFGVLHSTNYGLSFNVANNGLTNLNARTLFTVGNNLFAGTQGGAFITTNNGANWSAINSGLTNTDISAFAILGTNLFAGTAGGVFTSNNNGTSWTAVNSGLTNTSITSLDASGSIIYAGTTTGGIFRSSNSGANWVSVNSNLANLNIRSLQMSGTNLFAGTTSGVYFSTNNGVSWSSVSSGLPVSTSVLSFALTGSDIFVGTQAGLFYSTNNGQSWIDKNQGYTSIPSVNSIYISDGYLFTGTDIGLWRRDLSESVLISQISSEIPSGFSLSQNYPNPFNPNTVIGFQLPTAGFISIKIYDINGKEVSELVNENLKAGEYKINFDGSKLSTGVYFYKLTTDNFTQTKKMLLVK